MIRPDPGPPEPSLACYPNTKHYHESPEPTDQMPLLSSDRPQTPLPSPIASTMRQRDHTRQHSQQLQHLYAACPSQFPPAWRFCPLHTWTPPPPASRTRGHKMTNFGIKPHGIPNSSTLLARDGDGITEEHSPKVRDSRPNRGVRKRCHRPSLWQFNHRDRKNRK